MLSFLSVFEDTSSVRMLGHDTRQPLAAKWPPLAVLTGLPLKSLGAF